MKRDRRFPLLITGLLAVALVLSVVAWQSNPPRETVILAAPREASPWPDDYSAQLQTITALLVGTETPVPTATFVPRPSPTAPISCTGELPAGTACAGATSTPTEIPTHVVPPPTPIPTWPGEALQTPGAKYRMGDS